LPPEGRDHNSSRSESRWFIIWGWVKTLVPCGEPQVIAGIYGCE
jgi:hypothetical protein